MTANYKVREANASDGDFVSDSLSGMMWPLLPLDRKRDADEDETQVTVRGHVDFLSNAEGVVVLIAENNEGERVGVLLIGERRHLFTGRYEGFVHYLFVAPGSRRASVGRQLLREAEQLARRRNYVFLNFEVMAQNSPMRALASSLGYQEEYVGYMKFLESRDADEDSAGA